MQTINSEQLRAAAKSILDRVEKGASFVVTMEGTPIADLVPHRPEEPRWMPREELIELLKTHSADPGLRDDLARMRRVNVNDMWIAATAAAHEIPVFTQDGDFDALNGIAGPAVVPV